MRRAATVHVGGTFEQVALSEDAPWRGAAAEQPFVIVTQPSLFDATRAPAGAHTAWSYCHVPNGSTVDMTDRIEAQIERFAPGFREIVLARHTTNTRDLERHNANYEGGDISAGANVIRLQSRAVRADLHLCSAFAPPGPGVHGMCGYHAANTYLARNR